MATSTFQSACPDLTAKNLALTLQGVEKKWNNLGRYLYIPQEKRKDLEKKKNGPDSARMEAVFEYVLKLDPYASWRSIILALDMINETKTADRIRGYAECVADTSLTKDNATSVILSTKKDWNSQHGLADRLLIPNSVQTRIRKDKKVRKREVQLEAIVEYWFNTAPNASWLTLISVLHELDEKEALTAAQEKCKKVRKEKSLTVENLLIVLEGVSDVGLLEVWFRTPGSRERHGSSAGLNELQRKTILMRELVSSHPALNWKWVAWTLYRMAGEQSDVAVEKIIYEKKFLSEKEDMEEPGVEESISTTTVTMVPYCTGTTTIEQVDASDDVERPEEASSAWMQTDKMWGPRERPLKVHFLNDDVLETDKWMCGDAQMNVDNVLAWAQQWNSNAFPDIPKFEFSNSASKAHIRVHFGGTVCWSAIGTDAKIEKDKDKPTMNLALKGSGLDPDFQKYLVIHEFGHALGLQHEHQRSDFWKVAAKFIDEPRMRDDERLKNLNFNVDMAVLKDGGDKSKYDPDSVMHYWFDVNWLKDENHRTLEGVRSNDELTEEERKVLEGIHKRNKSFRVDGPSRTDLEFLQKCYGPDSSQKNDEKEPSEFVKPKPPQPVDPSDFSVDMDTDQLCAWLKRKGLKDKYIELLGAEDIDGGSFVALPRDNASLKDSIPGLTLGGAGKVSALIEKALKKIKKQEARVQNNLKKLRDALWDVRSEWESFGVELDIDNGTIKAIKKDYPTDVSGAFTELLSAWNKLSPPQSLDTIVSALRSKAISRGDIALKIEDLIKKGKLF